MITTGIYFRVNRDGKWQNLLFEELLYEERKEVLKDKEHEFVVSLCNTLADVINGANEYLTN